MKFGSKYGKAINASEDYKKASATWEGVVVLIFNAGPEIGLPEDFIVWADLWHGECREIKRVGHSQDVPEHFLGY